MPFEAVMDWNMHNAMMGTFPFQMLYDTISDPVSGPEDVSSLPASRAIDGAVDGAVADESTEFNGDSDAPEQAFVQTSVSLSAF